MTPAVVTCPSCRRELAPAALFCPGCGTPRVKDGPDDLIGKVLGERFLVQERLGHGKSGSIYRGEHVTLRRRVAIKVLHDGLSRDDLAVERFRREATSVAELDNEHIVEIHDFGRTPDNRLYMAMELLEGDTLDQVLAREQRLDVDRVVDILLQVGDALSFAHAVGFVHRDLRPRNIFLAVRRGKANFVKLLDFGLAKLVEGGGAAASTSLGMTFGDPRYMSPEQAKGEAIDRRADLYSLGCIAYEMLTGAPPFVGNKVFEVLSRHVSQAPVPLRERRGDAPPWLQAAIMRLLAKAPDDRFVTAARLVEALQHGLRTGETLVEPGDAASSSRRGPTGTPAVGVPAVAGAAEPGPAQATAMPAAAAPVVTAPVATAPVASAPVATAPVASAPVATGPVTPTPTATPTVPSAPLDEPAPRRRAPTTDPAESGSLSAGWFDGEDPSVSAARARRTVDPGDSLFDDDEYAPEPRRWVKPALIAGGALVLLLLVILIKGRGHDEAPTQAAVVVDAGVPAIDAGLPPVDAAAPVADAAAERHTAPTTPSTPTVPAVVDRQPTAPTPPTPTPPAPPVGDGSSELDRRVAGHGGATPPAAGDGSGDGSGDDTTPAPPAPADDDAARMAEFYANAGDAALRSGDPLGAAGNYNKALESNPSNLAALIGLGEVALQQGQYAGAIGYLKKAARLAPKSSRINTLLGEAYLNSGNANAAESAFKKALQADPDNGRARTGYNEAVGRLPPTPDDPDAP